MAQTLAEMIEEYGDIGAKNPWMNVHAYAALKQAQALQGIEAVLRLKVVGDPNYVAPTPRVPKRG